MGKTIIYAIAFVVFIILWKLYDVFMKNNQKNQIRKVKRNPDYVNTLYDEYDIIYNTIALNPDLEIRNLFKHVSKLKQNTFKMNYIHEASKSAVIFFTEFQYKDFAPTGASDIDINRNRFMVFIAKHFVEKNEIKVYSSTFEDNVDKSIRIQISRLILDTIVESVSRTNA